MKLRHLLQTDPKRAGSEERPSIDFLYAEGQDKQLGRGWHTNRAEKCGIKLLIVDDNEDAANMLAEAMKFYGYQTVVVYGGEEALDAIDLTAPDAAIFDLGMPGMSGMELAKRLRATRGGGDLLLIALTGWGRQEAGAASEAAGFDFHFVKPADPGALSALIDEGAFRRRVAGRFESG